MLQPGGLARRLVQFQQCLDEEGVIVEKDLPTDLPLSPPPPKTSTLVQVREQKARRLLGRGGVS
jgi:hypothetical protein